MALDSLVDVPSAFDATWKLINAQIIGKSNALDDAIKEFLSVIDGRSLSPRKIIREWNNAVASVDESRFNYVLDSTPINNYFVDIIKILLDDLNSKSVIAIWNNFYKPQ